MARKRKGEGQTALVTGASGGIGLELARCFARDGYGLVLAARSAEKLSALAADLAREFQVAVVPIAIDLGVPGAGAELVKAIEARGIAVDVLVNNAGYGVKGAFADGEIADQLGMVDLNMRALVELTGLLWPRMLKNGRGGVLNVASTGAFQPAPLMAVYCATKAFVLSFTEALWDEARGTGVHASCLCPGPTATGFASRAGVMKSRLFRTGGVMAAARVARIGYAAFQANKRVKVTGLMNRLMAWSVKFSPRAMVFSVGRKLLSAPA